MKELNEYFQKELLLLIKHARHDLPWFYMGLSHASDKTSSVSYQFFPERFEGTHIQFGCDDRNFDRSIPNDDGQTLQECLKKIVSGKIRIFSEYAEKDPRAQGAHWHQYRFYELQSDGSYAKEVSSCEFYSITPSEAEALMEVDKMEIDVPQAPEPKTPKKTKRV
jgi:hypothetical protein